MSNAQIEGLKEVGRWVVLFVISWIITATLDQATQIPEAYPVKVWVFTYTIPVRQLIVFLLTMLGRYVDKWLHVSRKEKLPEHHEPMGIIPF